MKTFKDLFKNKKILVIGILLFVLILIGIFIWSNSKTDKEVDYRNYVTGLRSWKVEVGTEDVDYLSGITWNDKYIEDVTIDDKDVYLDEIGSYDLYYIIDVKEAGVEDIEVLRGVEVVSKEDAKKDAEKGEEVATKEGIQNKKSEEDLKKAEESKKTSSNTNKQSNSNGNTAKADSGKKNSSSSSSKPSSNSNSKPSSNSNKEDKPSHKHHWEQQYKSVYHDEVSHEEEYVIKAAWTETVPKYETQMHTFCLNPTCGRDLTASGEDVFAHAEAHALKYESDSTGEKPVVVQIGTETINHPAEMGKRKVVDKEAYTEQVPDGYKCSECGARK